MENWAAIAAEIGMAIAEVGFAATITRPSAALNEVQKPWDSPAVPVNASTVFAVTVIDDGIRDFYQGGLITRRVRVLTIATGAVVPVKSDAITVRGLTHVIDVVRALAPGGVDLLYECEISA